MTTRIPIIAICGRKGSGKDTVADILREKYHLQPVAFADPFKRMMMRVFDISEEVLWGPSAVKEKTLKSILKRQDVTLDESYWIDVHVRADEHTQEINSLFYDVEAGTQHCPDPLPSLFMFIRDFKRIEDTVTLRHMMQQIGSQWGRRLWKDVWCYHACKAVDLMAKGQVYTRADGITGDVTNEKPAGFIFTDCRFPDNEAQYAAKHDATFWWIDSSKRIMEVFDPRARGHESEPFKENFKDAGIELTIINNNGPQSDLKDIIAKEMRKR